MPARAVTQRAAALLLLGAAVAPVQAWVLTANSGPRSVFLQVGNGSGGLGNNATINLVSLTVPAAQVGNGVEQAFTSDSTTATSPFRAFAVCNPPQQVYIGARYRRAGAGTDVAVLQVSTPAMLNSGADTLLFTSIRWTSTANGNPAADIPAGRFTGSTQFLRNIARNTAVENCLSFFYDNATVPAAGTYTGRATYTLVSP